MIVDTHCHILPCLDDGADSLESAILMADNAVKNGIHTLLYGVPDYFDELLFELHILQIIPVIAHPERNLEFIGHPDCLMEYVNQGVLCQVTAHSLFGVFGKKNQRFANKLCKENLAHIIASDGHNTNTRPMNLAQALAYISASFWEDRAQYYLNNANLLIRGEMIEHQTLSQKRRKWFLN